MQENLHPSSPDPMNAAPSSPTGTTTATKPRKSKGSMIWGSLYPPLIFVGMQMVVGMVYAFILIFSLIFQGMSSGAADPLAMLQDDMMQRLIGDSMLITLIVDVVLIPLYYFLFRLDRRSAPQTKISSIRPLDYLLVAVLAIASNFLISAVIVGFNLYSLFPDYANLGEMIGSAPMWLRFLTVGIAAPIVEELLMRGLVLDRMRRYMPVIPAILIQAVIFGVIHMNILQGAYAALLGVILGIIYVRYNSIVPCIVFHIVLNSLSVLLPENFGADWNPLVFGLISLVIVAGGMFLLKIRKVNTVHHLGENPVPVPETVVAEETVETNR